MDCVACEQFCHHKHGLISKKVGIGHFDFCGLLFQILPYNLHHPMMSAQQSVNPLMLRKSLNQLLQKSNLELFLKCLPHLLYFQFPVMKDSVKPKSQKESPMKEKM